MPNQVILPMQGSKYPFYQTRPQKNRSENILVQKIVQSERWQQKFLAAKNLKKLAFSFRIQYKSVLKSSQKNEFQIYYEFVPVKYEKWMKNFSDELVPNIKKQLCFLTYNLANNGILVQLNAQNIGLGEDFCLRYFIDVEQLLLCSKISVHRLLKDYHRQINLVFEQFQNKSTMSVSSIFRSLKFQNPEGKEFQSIKSKCISKSFSLQSIGLSILDPEKQTLKQTENITFTVSQSKDKPTLTEDQQRNGLSSEFQRSISSSNLTYTDKTSQSRSFRNTFCQDSSPSGVRIGTFNKAYRKNYSQYFKTPKNSESPVEYLDIIRSNQSYVQDFLNVLEDNQEDEEKSNVCISEQDLAGQQYSKNEEKMPKQKNQKDNRSVDQFYTVNKTVRRPEPLTKFQLRFNKVMDHSKRLIEHMKSKY